MSRYHTSVLLEESLEALDITPGKRFIDCTLGGGGHTIEILKRGGNVLGIDVDEDALGYVYEKVKDQKSKIKNFGEATLVKGNFKDLGKIARENGFEQVSGILFDLGVSSYQLDTGDRGFSFLKDAELDMRMDQSLSVTAKDLVNGLTRHELTELFHKLGEERYAGKIAEVIVKKRLTKPIETTGELAKIIRHTVPGGKSGVHPATRVFQALRIAVNDELNSLRDALPQAVKLLLSNGRLTVISFHSLEDRIVKQALNEFVDEGLGLLPNKKPISPTTSEIADNPRARSAKLRVFERI